MRKVSVAGQFSRRPRLIGSFFGDFGDPGEAGQRWQPPVPFEQSTGSRDRTPASGGGRFVPRRPAPSTGTGLGASASFSPRCRTPQAPASSMGVQGFQRLRKADLIGAIIAKAQGVEFVPSPAPARSRRGGAQA